MNNTEISEQNGFVMRPLGKVARTAYVLIGVAFYVTGMYLAVRGYSLVTNSKTTQGVVVDVSIIQSTHRGRVSTSYSPVIKFTAVDGKEYSFIGQMSSIYKPVIGTSKDIIYSKLDPKNNAEANSEFDLWIIPIVLLFFGLVMMYVGFFVKLVRTRAGLWPFVKY